MICAIGIYKYVATTYTMRCTCVMCGGPYHTAGVPGTCPSCWKAQSGTVEMQRAAGAAVEMERAFEDLDNILRQVTAVLGQEPSVNQANFKRRKIGGWMCTMQVGKGGSVTAKTGPDAQLTPETCACLLQLQAKGPWNILVNGREDKALGDEVGSLMGVTVSSCVTEQEGSKSGNVTACTASTCCAVSVAKGGTTA